MPTQHIDKVRKRGGAVVAYAESKIAGAIQQASRAAGLDNRYLAEDLAGVVTLYLERYHDKDIPTSDEIRRIVCKILKETGHSPIAQAFSEFRGREAPVPAAAVRPAELFPASAIMVEGHARGEVSLWDRRRIVAALQREARVHAERAEQIAATVEQRIFAMKVSRVSTAVIRELVNQELIGARGDVLSQIVVGVPKYDLGQMMASPRGLPDADELSLRVGEAAIQQYALQEIFRSDVSAAHLEGRLHIHRIEQPLKLYWITPDLEGLKRTGLAIEAPAHLSDPPQSARDLTAITAAVVRAARARVAEAVELSHLNLAYAGLLSEADDAQIDREVEYLTTEICPPGRLGVCIGALPAPAQPQRKWVERAEHAARRMAAGLLDRPGATVFVGPQGFNNEADLALLRRACAHPPVRFVLDRGAPARPAVSRFARTGSGAGSWFCIAQAVTVNLPQAVYRAGGEAGLDAELEHAVELAVRAHLDKRRILKRFAADGVVGFGHADGWATQNRGLLDPEQFHYVIGICGLAEAVQLLWSRPLSGDEGAARGAFRILSYLFAMIKQAAEVHRIHLSLQDIDGEEPAKRFGRIDIQMYPAARDIGASYTPGPHASPGAAAAAERIRIESRFHTLIPSGSVILTASSATDLFSQLLKIQAETLAGQVYATRG